MNRRNFLRVVGGGFVFAATAPVLNGCIEDVPTEANAP